jgi:serine protease
MLVSSVSRGPAVAALFVAVAAAQRLPEPPREVLAAAVHLDRLHVKLAEGTGAELKAGHLRSRTGVDLTSVDALFAEATASPLVTAVSWDELDRWHRAACAVQPPHNRPGHLGLWFRLQADEGRLAALRERLRANPLVADLHHEPRLVPASVGASPAMAPLPPGGDIPPTTPSFTGLQYSHGPTPTGHGVRAVGGVHGARGTGITFVMMEQSYVLGHEDVCQLVGSSFLGPVPPLNMTYALHGLSGAAIVSADRNGYGITGVADEVTARFMSIELNGTLPNAIAIAIANTQPGDVVLIVMMVIAAPLGPGAFVPFEFYEAGFDATLTATSLGRHMVVPAGNGNLSLDDPAFHNRFDRTFRDSGAIIVGASQGALLQRAPYCTWGSRVDAHSWGDGVASCGYGTLFFPNNDVLQSYTTAATGTSSATPHLAGIVAAVQGAAKRQLGHVLTNQQLVALLHAHGPTTPDEIGRRPDLVAILQALGVLDGLAVDEPDLQPGGTITVTMDGATNDLVGLFGSFAPGSTDLGFNRRVLLDLPGIVPCGAFVLGNGTATWQLAVPADPALHDADVFFQAVRLSATAPLHVTNSCQVSIL